MLKEFKKKETNRYELDITVDAEKFADAVKKAYAQNGKKINLEDSAILQALRRQCVDTEA